MKNIEVREEKIYTLVCSSYSEGTSTVSFRYLKDAKKYVNDDIEGVENDLIEQGYRPKRIERPDKSIEIYVPDTGIYWDFRIEESSLY